MKKGARNHDGGDGGRCGDGVKLDNGGGNNYGSGENRSTDMVVIVVRGGPTWCLVTDLVGEFGPDVFEAVHDGSLHPGLEAGDAVERLHQLVGLSIRGWSREV